LVTHPEIAPAQARLTPEFFTGGLLKKKVYLGGMSILSILLNLESGCHNVGKLQSWSRGLAMSLILFIKDSAKSFYVWIYGT
jgi:hypothetical protein